MSTYRGRTRRAGLYSELCGHHRRDRSQGMSSINQVFDLAAEQAVAEARRDEAGETRRKAWRTFETAVDGEAAESPPTETLGYEQDEDKAEADE